VTGFLLDTCVISELVKTAPDSNVLSFLSGLETVWLSAVTLHELDYGIERLPPGKRRSGLQAAVGALMAQYDDRILPFGWAEARQAALLRVEASRQGRVMHLADAMIAATAKEHDLIVATPNVADFAGLSVRVADPWLPPAN
jgi:predicted nucleic acid-binding protein